MEFRIADTFTDSLARLTGEQQKAVKTTVFDLQLNPAHPGMQLHTRQSEGSALRMVVATTMLPAYMVI
jgi:hypothetical protein